MKSLDLKDQVRKKLLLKEMKSLDLKDQEMKRQMLKDPEAKHLKDQVRMKERARKELKDQGMKSKAKTTTTDLRKWREAWQFSGKEKKYKRFNYIIFWIFFAINCVSSKK